MNTQNFAAARALRRRIINELTKQQAVESSCSEKLREVISHHTKAILEIISGLLMGYKGNCVSGDDKALFSRVAPSSITFENWLRVREEEINAATEKQELFTRTQSAQAAYDRIAPLGFISGWFADANEEMRISVARSGRDSLRAQYAAAEQKHRVAIQKVQNHATLLLRNMMLPESLRILSIESPVKDGLQTALNGLNRQLTDVWTVHIERQTASLESVRAATADLFALYEPQDLAESVPLLKGRNALSSN